MPAAEKGSIYESAGRLYKVLGFANQVITGELLVLYSRYRKNNEIDEEILAEPLNRFTSNNFSRIEIIQDKKEIELEDEYDREREDEDI